MRRVRGFSLLEIMMAVLVLGILATAAIPSFMTYRSKAMRSEMKINLGALRSTEQMYLSNGHIYTDNLQALGWEPDGTPIYLYGFTSDALPGASGRNDTAELRAAGVANFKIHRMVDVFGTPLTESDLPEARASARAMTAGAVGNIDQDATLDAWTISSDGRLRMVTNDLAN